MTLSLCRSYKINLKDGVQGWGATSIEPRKHHIYTGLTNIINPIIYLLSTSYEPIFIATIFTAMSSLIGPANQAMVAESLPRNRMGTGYAIFNAAQRIPMLLSGFIGGMLMDSLGLAYGTRLCLVGALIGRLSKMTEYSERKILFEIDMTQATSL
jgi:MFS family permease